MADAEAGLEDRIASLEAQLDAAQRTVHALTSRVELLDGGDLGESSAMARALAGMQRELARRTETLEQAEATYRALYESTPDPLLTVDGEGMVLACNRTGLDWIGLPLDQVLGQPLWSLFDAGERATVEALSHAGWAGASERRFSLFDGRRASLNASRIHGSNRYHLTIWDVTNREVLEGAEDERRRMVALAEFAGALARELNDPMSIVQGRLELLLEIGLRSPESLERHLSISLTHARRISATLQNLRLVGHTTVPHLARVYVSDALSAALELVGPRVGGDSLAVVIEPEDLAIGGVEAMYSRVFANLLDRMVDFCGRGGRIEFSARVAQHAVVVRILGGARLPSVADLVLPPPGDAAHIAEGGIGVSITERLIHAMGGTLEIRSSTQRACFEMVLAPAPTVRARARPVESTILVVGSEALLTSLEKLLGRDGFQLERAPDAEAALAALAGETRLDGLVTELLLPGRSGLSLVGEIGHRHPRLSGRVVLVSDGPLVPAPRGVRVLEVPLRRSELLSALGRRVRRSR